MRLAGKVALITGAGSGQGREAAVTEQIQNGVAFAVRSFGALNVLYNNAGVYLRGKDGPVTRVEEDIWDTTLTVNLKSMYLCCKHAIPEMVKVGGGSIVNTASAAGLIGSNFHAYSASKGGMIALSRSIATTYAPQNIRSNVICPGFIETPMNTPLHKTGKPIDIAYMALYLASDEAAFVTGGVFVIDGGVTAR